MKLLNTPLLSAIFLLIGFRCAAQFQFIAPMPNSTNHNIDRNIVIREGHVMDESILQRKSQFSITGSKSGVHDFTIELSNDHRTVILKPVIPFTYSEKITVQLKNGLKRADGAALPALSFSFSTHRKFTAEEQQQFENALQQMDDVQTPNSIGTRAQGNVDVLVNTNPASGQVIYDFEGASPTTPTGCNIIKSNGDSVFSFNLPSGTLTDFKINHNGYFTFVNRNDSIEMLDSNYHFIRSFKPVNGYKLDNHEFQIFPDGHYYLLATDDSIIDMTQFNPSYNPHANVTGTVIQEFDAGDHLIFEWRSFDHVNVLEGKHVNFSAGTIDYVHTNSIEEDDDGNIIVSHRNIAEITKIDVNTGDFIWRLGGDSNQFAFINDPDTFNYQHDARKIANGDLTLFDNNNFGIPNTAMAKEYTLDIINKTATLVWSYQHPLVNGAPIVSRAMGSVQRLPNGGTFIDWGFIASTADPSFTEIDANDTIVWEGKVLPNTDIVYRAHRNIWAPCARVSDQTMSAINIAPDSATLSWSPATNAASYEVQYKDSASIIWTTTTVNAPDTSVTLTNLKSGTMYQWQIQTLCDAPNPPQSNLTAIKEFKTPFGTGIADAAIQNIKLFPNPAQNFVTIQSEGAAQISEIIMLNELGETVLYENISSAKKNEIRIPLQNLAAGPYTVKAISNQKTFVQKLLVEK